MGHSATSQHKAEHHEPAYYVKIWAVLLVLLIISITGPMLEIRAVTLITAFGIAIVKALMVAAYFMHLNIEKRIAWYVILTMFVALLMFISGIAPDVGKMEGRNWENKAHKEHALKHQASSPGHEGGGHN